MWRQSPAAVCSPVRNKASILFPLLDSSLSLLQRPPSTTYCLHSVSLLSDQSTGYTSLILLNALSRPLIFSVTASSFLPRTLRSLAPLDRTAASILYHPQLSYDSSIFASTSCIPGLEILFRRGSGINHCALVSFTGTINRAFRLSHGVRPGSQTNGPSGVVTPGSQTGVFCRNRRVVLKDSSPSRILFACSTVVELLSSGSPLFFRSPSHIGRGYN